MSGGGLMQLVAYGSQDVYLTGNPQVTFFKQLYRRHTNFAMQSVEAQFNGNPGFGRRVSLVVPRVGDLMGKTYVYVELPALSVLNTLTAKWINEVGHFLLKEIELQIGGQVIDKHYGTWLSIWFHLTIPTSKNSGYMQMIGATTNTSTELGRLQLWVPLQFWFCKNDGLALPLIALQYHEVRFVVQFASLAEITENASPDDYTTGQLPELEDAKLFIDYIFLDSDERRKFATVSHEYLIDQLQFTGDENLNTTGDTKIRLNFNHPVKELVWVCLSNADLERSTEQYSVDATGNLVTNDIVDSGNPIAKAKLQFNGHDRFSERDGRYFSTVQPWQHHTTIPIDGINVYSFALHPEMEQPSGTANFSRIDNATLILSLTTTAQTEVAPASGDLQHSAKIFAVGFNVLRIMSGMGGLAYSN